ncbi:dehydrodolichyl diphosphate synthase CPT3-like [Lycium barbarum]|uniref:dehydrodolichyl diphosphate synthase CPT3-like n=1 Tax=Lycium barbarum TaxID=112863 RepID=UPI00293E4B4C|nr:dehydrodolichyl diphosphate synthase CPT3-like [Lycium barbarum]
MQHLIKQNTTSNIIPQQLKHLLQQVNRLLQQILHFVRQCIFSVLDVGPIPSHIAFVMDGNRRYSKKQNLLDGDGHRAGFSALINMLRYCYELGVKYKTVYAFSIDNFKRRPEEVLSLMRLMQEKIDELIKEESIINRLGIRIYFKGNLKLLSDPVSSAAERAMVKTACNSKAVLYICVAYTSTDEIVHAVQESCEEKWDEIRKREAINAGGNLIGPKENGKDNDEHLIGVTNVDRHMYMSVCPDPDIIIRTSGATRLSNFLLWQSTHCLLYSPAALWPEIGLSHLVWIVLDFQRNYLNRPLLDGDDYLNHIETSSSDSDDIPNAEVSDDDDDDDDNEADVHPHMQEQHSVEMMQSRPNQQEPIPIKDSIKNVEGVYCKTINKRKGYLRRRCAFEMIYGTWEGSFKQLLRYMAAIQKINPGTVVE